MAKKSSKMPKWIRDTLETVIMIAVLMAAYNFFGPLVFKNGSYFPWWTYPYSVGAALLIVGAWNFAARKFRLLNQQLKDEEAAKQRAQIEREKQAARQDQQEAVKRRNRNQSKQQSR
ncbi:hypothetical protein FEZ41_08860 [Lentilactobacillus parafarraginis]|jgi:hypothetical protein|uniref:Integral membrane protein n=2 Tax=Lentilactobacillus parafarraginis TaxID=390842 RepID=A0A0R1YMI5_9LACO|nr:hypothetical protein [Lentilactobacillus parafarraginis]KRM43680.1 hypothetical protein FD47_GL001482 [Lentilactobacillus parafarraginis DSM 18390 = JCM 14109]TLQ18577.1 hypothetical protein FEZ41_08860 [Lentilactobacillus parafarraginis]